MMKRVLCGLLVLLSVLVLGSCRASSVPPSDEGNPDAETEAAQRLSYYEQMVGALQEELRTLRAELYVNEVTYEARIASLEAALRATEEEEAEVGGEPSEKRALFSYRQGEEGLWLTAYHGDAREVVVPATLEGVPVYGIDENAFAGQTRIVSVVLPEGVKSIGWFAFSGCVSLRSITLPESLSHISYGAFEGCGTSLTISCARDSYAEQYAHSYGFSVQR